MKDDSERGEDRAGRPPSHSPGTRLKAAREARGLTLEEAAKSLLISPALLAALEADDFERLGASVYARGYLRKYARFLELPADELVANYQLLATPREPRVRARPVASLPRHTSARWLAPTAGGIVVIVIILIALWVWRSGLIHETAANPPAAAVSAAMAMTNVTPAVATVAHVAAPTVSRASAPASHAPGAVAATYRLQLKVNFPSWVEVYDRNGKRLYYDLASAGQTLSFTSSAVPFRVFLGNAPGVEVELNGNPVVLPAGSVSGTVARFEVPATGTNPAPAPAGAT